MTSLQTLSTFQVADFTLRYRRDECTHRIGVDLFPTAMEAALAVRLPNTGKEGAPLFHVDPLVHLKLMGDAYTASFGQGRTMRIAPTVDRFLFQGQTTHKNGTETVIKTTLASADGCRIEHGVSWHDGDRAIKIKTAFVNASQEPQTLEMLSSFSLGGISPFDGGDVAGRLKVHRFRTVWCAEGRLETQSAELLHLERSATGHGAYSERFGQIGSMPARGWFPFAAIEDTVAGVVWGAQLAWGGSWQMELFRKDDQLCLSGGLADREFGHWTKTLAPGETLETPTAAVSCVHGDLDDLCDRLTDTQQRAADTHPEVEHDLPIIFNEWCTTWGRPTHERLQAIASRLAGTETKYLVIDAGWYDSHGDWLPRKDAFPDGLKAAADTIRKRGLIPGLWFEAETCGDGSLAFSLTDYLLKRDGFPITVGERRFWDLTDPFAIAHLEERMTRLPEECGIGYVKVDYNETIGFGCDGAESPGEGLRRQTLGTYALFERLRKRLPDLVIENCASGGHRLEPSLLGETAMSSFSDAHELSEIPIIAANLQRLLLPRQSQVWAVLRKSDTPQRLVYSLAATFLGRMCLSGDIDLLGEAQWQIVLDAQRLYRQAAPIIKYGRSRRVGTVGESWRHPTGWQAVTRLSDDGGAALVVAHAFAGAPNSFEVPLPPGNGWAIAGRLRGGAFPTVSHSCRILTSAFDGDFSGQVIILRRTD